LLSATRIATQNGEEKVFAYSSLRISARDSSRQSNAQKQKGPPDWAALG
jgi:hypothetical protein